MARPNTRFYVDTSVFGGIEDDEFKKPSLEFFSQARQGRFLILSSAVVAKELAAAPLKIRRLYEELLPSLETIAVDEETLRLQRAYLDAGILSPDSALDALHIALATISGAQGIVSWNFKHIVHFQKIPKYNAVNQLNGWQPIGIYSPQEVLSYEDQDL